MPASTRQRSLRLHADTLERLDARAGELGISANALAQRLLDEALRLERHPLIRFRRGATGTSRPALVGTRLDVHRVVTALRAERGEIAATAARFGIAEVQVRACLAYYADFRAEVDAETELAARTAREQRARHERERRALA